MDSSASSQQPQQQQSRPTHISLPPPPSFTTTFLSTPSPSQRDDPFTEDLHSPYLQFFTAPSTPCADPSPPQPPSPAPADYFTPPISPATELPATDSVAALLLNTPIPPQLLPSPESPLLPSQTPLMAAHSASNYVSHSSYGTDDIYPGIPVDIVNDLILDDGSLTALEKIFLFCQSKQVVHRFFIVRNMPRLLKEVIPQDAVEYVLPLFRELVLDQDESIQEEFGRSLGDVMWWFLTSCRVVEVIADRTGLNDDEQAQLPAQIHYQTFTPLFGSLLLSSNVLVSEAARNSITLILERIKKADDKDTLTRGDHLRSPLPPENLWKAPAADYAMDDPEIEEEEPELGLFGPEERIRIKHEILAAIVVALGRLDSLWQDGGGLEETPATGGHNVDERRSWLEAQTGDGVQVVSPGGLGNLENGVTTSSTDLEASSSNVIIKEGTVNPYFPIVPSAYSTPSSTSSTPSSSNSASSSSGSSPTVPPAGVSPSSPVVDLSTFQDNTAVGSRSSPPRDPDATIRLQVPIQSDTGSNSATSSLSTTSPQVSSQFDRIPAFLQHEKSCHRKGPLAYSLNPGHMMREGDGDILYDEQVANGRWSTMRLVAAVAANGTADLETEVYFIREVDRSVQDPVYWVRREAAFAIGALARVVPDDFVYKDLVPMFGRLVTDPHPDVRQNILFSLPPLVQRLSSEHRRRVTYETLMALSEDPEITVRQSALDTLSETIYAFVDDAQGPPDFLLHMYLGRKEDNIVRNGTRLITFEIPPPLEAFYLDTKRPLTLAFGFPAVTLTLGKERWGELREAYLDLAANRMNDVKRALAAGMGEIARIIGSENTRQDLIQVWWNFINHPKDADTRIHAIENMEALITVAGKEMGLLFWEGVLKNWEAKVFRVWRERKIILEELLKMPELLGGEILPIVGAIQALALVDLEQGVRDIAVSLLPKVQGLLSSRKDLVDGLNTAVSQLLSSTFRRRMTFASCQRSIFLALVDAGQKPSVALTDDMLRMIFNLSQDSVVDVKISVARFVGSVYDKFVRETEPVPALLAEIVQQLSQDSSLSVKIYIPDPATLLDGKGSVAFPSSDETVESVVTPGQPSRSRHFSKPPLSRLNSSVSATDYPGTVIPQSMAISADRMVDRPSGGTTSDVGSGVVHLDP